MNKDIGTVSRVGISERIASLDVIRGIAILFILFLNIPDMGSYLAPDPRVVSWTQLDKFAYAFQIMLNGTQRGLLEVLFGAGILIMARHAMQPDAPVGIADLHYRRNLLLIVFGLANALLLFWFGDILLPYGIAALMLFHFRLWQPRNLLIMAALFFALSNIAHIQRYLDRSGLQASGQMLAARESAGTPLKADEKETLKEWRDVVASYLPAAESTKKQEELAKERAWRLGSMGQYAKGVWSEWLTFFQPSPFFFVMGEIIATMLLGMALFKLGFIQGSLPKSTYLWFLILGWGIGFFMRAVWAVEAFSFSPAPRTGWLTYDLSRVTLTMGHIAAVHLLIGTRLGQRLLAPFQAAGRMPLTVYMLGSVVTMWVLFPGFGLGLFGRFGEGALLLIAVSIITAQLVAANIWLKRFSTGPLEWIWKSLAYAERQPFRRVETRPPILAAAK